MTDFHQAYQVVAALIRQDDQVLLVRQQGPNDAVPNWALPGGGVGLGELWNDALIREIREETGLTVTDPGYLLYTLHHYNTESGDQAAVWVFTVTGWQGTLHSADPEGMVSEARFMPIAEALDKLEQHLPWRVMRDPLIAHLRGEARPGAVWLYRRNSAGEDVLVQKLDGFAGDTPKRTRQTKPKTETTRKSSRKKQSAADSPSV